MNIFNRRMVFLHALGLLLAVCASMATAQEWPARPPAQGGCDGEEPSGGLLAMDGVLLGLTGIGGEGYGGTIFKIRSDATGYAIVHPFEGTDNGPSEIPVQGSPGGRKPAGSLVARDGMLYGMTGKGGARGMGTIFRIRPNGQSYAVLHTFSGQPSDGGLPHGSLEISGGVLYGMTFRGGANNLGAIFKINLDGSGFAVLHSFTGTTADGSVPEGSLLSYENALFGMMPNGGTNKEGLIFKINRDGSGFTVLHSFTGRRPEDGVPTGSLIAFRGVLYGTTSQGFDMSKGAIFRINPDGSGFAVLHTFGVGLDDGAFPLGSLVASGDALYGVTARGGAGVCRATWGTRAVIGCGTIFKIEPDGTKFALLHAFDLSDGASPLALVASGGVLYGTTGMGGKNGGGTVYKINPDGGGFAVMHLFGCEVPPEGR